jgi:hypothetical protein
MAGLVVKRWTNEAVKEGGLLIDYPQAKEALRVAASYGTDCLPVLGVGLQFRQFVVVVGYGGDGIVVAKHVLDVADRRITEHHVQFFPIFHEDYAVLLENTAI